MAQNYEDQGSIRRYLLHQLTGEEQQQIEQRLLTEDDVFEELEIAEDELIDDYLRRRLSEVDRKRFEEKFLATPGRQQKMRFSRSLSRYVRTTDSLEKNQIPSSLAFWNTNNLNRVAAAAVAVAIVVAGIFWFSPQPTPPALATFTLTISNSTRGEGPQVTKVTLPPNVEVLRLRLDLPETTSQPTNYRVELLTEKGTTQTLPIAGQDARSVVVDIPAAQLSHTQYALNVSAIKADGTEQRLSGSYYFRVE